MEDSRKWTIAVLVVAVVGVVVFAAVGYALLRGEKEVEESSTVSIVGSDLATSDLVDHGSGTASDPYVITGLDVPVWGSVWGKDKFGIVVHNVDDYLVLSGSRIHGEMDLNYHSILIGIRLYNSHNVTVLDCRLENLSRGVDLESCESINITVNQFSGCDLGVHFDSHHSDDVSVYDNSFEETIYGIYAAGWENGIGCSQLSVRENGFGYCNHALWIDESDAVTIANNTAHDLEGLILQLSHCDKATVIGNSIGYSYGAAAFSFFEVSNLEIKDNTIGSVNSGISISQSSIVTIAENYLNAGTCVSIEDSSSIGIDHNWIVDATVGFWIADSKSVNITRCYITSYVGVQLLSSGDDTTAVMIHHNNLNCDIPALDNSGAANTWDDGVGEGNHWGDSYTGSDSDSDGIGDTPFVIDEDSSDRYPLMTHLIFE